MSTICTNAVLIMKAYIAHGRSRPLLYLGIISMIVQFAPLTVILHETKVLVTTDYGCIADVPPYYSWLRLGLDLPVNLLFSAAFLHVVVSNYTRHGSKAWKILSREGITYMLYATILNLAAAAIMASQLLGTYSIYIYVLDWYISSCLILAQQKRTAASATKEKGFDMHAVLLHNMPS
ncbi:hypothetical protein THASP1DRAFT_32505 [Thamnocephalis sphaerospora]|uniref:Uncharacterized protein n=1 Tax=Thamnocephalis sphaerospora TaxID=78915 RepID=A0A4P9XIW9_9FUNG|nr:hypothetical protein THASP1DRAFT_32505 [Thamnocephalis sphaerospora]|eukprot:RKP05658.1 hypothetical protein THASP1DRAFT_32505 [Thamnocephalis sphaerospora]